MTPAIKQIVRRVLPHFGMEGSEPEAILAKDKHATLVSARQVSIWLARHALGWSYPELGRQFGRDHTTCITAVQKIDRMVKLLPDHWVSVAATALLVEVKADRAAAPALLRNGAHDLEIPGPSVARVIELADASRVGAAE